MDEFDKFLAKYDNKAIVEEYSFYNGEVTLYYNDKKHVYYTIQDGQEIVADGVTTTLKIIDKSSALIPWCAKVCAEKALKTIPVVTLPNGERRVNVPYSEFERVILESKSAHTEHLEAAGNIGHLAHAWIEQCIKAELAGGIDPYARPFPENEKSTSCCKAALSWIVQHKVKFTSTEQKIYSRLHNYAGTADGTAIISSCNNEVCCPTPFTDRLSLIDWKSSNYLYSSYILQTGAYVAAIKEELGHDIQDRWIIRLGKEDGAFESWHIGPEHFEEDFEGFLTCLKLTKTMRALKTRIDDDKQKVRAHKKEEKALAKAAAKEVERLEKVRIKEEKKARKNEGNTAK